MREKDRAVTSASRDYLTQSAVYVPYQIKRDDPFITTNKITRKHLADK